MPRRFRNTGFHESDETTQRKATVQKVDSLFKSVYRGKVKAKNKGEIDMYFLKGIQAEYSVNAEGRVLNEKFKAAYENSALQI